VTLDTALTAWVGNDTKQNDRRIQNGCLDAWIPRRISTGVQAERDTIPIDRARLVVASCTSTMLHLKDKHHQGPLRQLVGVRDVHIYVMEVYLPMLNSVFSRTVLFILS
jgi:hypothetical protein